ncbi:transcriptional regulator [Candidatus Brocadia pituitae]|nr:transcriptional regulator [Candidatus Brocadia pituitae]
MILIAFRQEIEISNFSVISGYFPPRALGIVMEWAALHKDKLLENWEAAEQKKPLIKIEPLK